MKLRWIGLFLLLSGCTVNDVGDILIETISDSKTNTGAASCSALRASCSPDGYTEWVNEDRSVGCACNK